jgi:hypothetical protein
MNSTFSSIPAVEDGRRVAVGEGEKCPSSQPHLSGVVLCYFGAADFFRLNVVELAKS